MRLTILGGGGFRVPLVHQALLDAAAHGDPTITEVVLHDRDPRRMDAIATVLERQRDAHRERHGAGPRLAVRSETDLDAALRGSGMVFSAIRVGGLRGRVLDERVALEAGVVGQETVGAGGISFGLRTLPVAEHVARRVAETAPDAWVINFTNPAGLVTEAMSAVLGNRVIGICDSPVALGRRVARALGLDPAGVRFDYAGLNHLGWLRAAHAGGRDRLPDLLSDDAALASFEEGRLFGAEWLRALGAVPNEYLHYYYMRREALGSLTDAYDRGATRGQQLADQQEDFYRDALAAPEKALLLWDRARRDREETYLADNRRAAGGGGRDHDDLDGGGYERVALAVLRAVTHDEPARLIVNTRNRGALPGLDDDAVVELPCVVDGGGAHPLTAAPLTHHQAGLVHAVKDVERATIDAVRTGSRTHALRALGTHPLVDSVPTARALLDAYLHAFPDLRQVLHRS